MEQRLNLTLDDYKYYSSIEIELKFDDGKYGKFINISDYEKGYFHIYFDNSKNEISRNYLDKNDKVKTIKIFINNQVKSFNQLFDNCLFINSIFFKKFKTDNITDMSYMFNGCTSLKELNLSEFNTEEVTNFI